MTIQTGYMLRQIADTWLVVPLGERVVDFNGLLTLNDTGALLWQLLEQGAETDQLVRALLDTYDVAATSAASDAEAFLETLREGGLLVA